MKLNKWNYEKNKYELYEIPDDWIVPIITDLDIIVNCPHCGKKLPYGKTYTSLEIHTGCGFGYGVCDKCYQEEWERKKKYECSNT